MLSGIGFLAVITASVTASWIESSQRRFNATGRDMGRQLDEVSERLARIETALEPPSQGAA